MDCGNIYFLYSIQVHFYISVGSFVFIFADDLKYIVINKITVRKIVKKEAVVNNLFSFSAPPSGLEPETL